MTSTDSPTTAVGRVWSVTEPIIPSGGERQKTPTDRGDWLSWSPWMTAGQSVDRYFRFVNLTLELNRQLAAGWPGPAGPLSGASREQPDTGGGRSMPKRRPNVTEGTPSWDADTGRQVAGDRIAKIRRTRTGPARRPDEGGATTTQHGDRLTGQGGAATGIVDGLIGHLLDLDITGSLGTNS